MRRALILLVMLGVVAPLAAVPEPTADELQANRRRLEQLRKQQPELLEKLRTEAKEFFALPKERRQRIVDIHKELQKQSPATRSRLIQVLARYVEWLEDLEPVAKSTLAAPTDKKKRLELLRDLREQEWTKDQPKATQDKLAQLAGDAKKAFIAKEKAEERQRRFDWLIAKNFWTELVSEAKGGKRSLPTRFSELPPPVKNYVSDYLLKMFLSQEEKDELAKLEGQWPQYPMKLVELADKHPPALPGPLGPKSFVDLPAKVYSNKEFLGVIAARLKKKEPPALPSLLGKLLRIPEGAWPDFGIALAKFASQKSHVFEHEFLAFKLDCLSPPMREFVSKKLEPVLDGKESLRLANAVGKWPDYPQTIQDLAQHRHLHVPWFTLPGGEKWENYRVPKMTALSP